MRETGGVKPRPPSPALVPGPGRGTLDYSRVNPGSTYELTENAMRLSRLEDEKNLIRSLRHLVRSLHEGGRQIAFQTPEAVDRIQLRSINLPTDPEELLGLVLQVFARRQEPFDLDGVYADFVRSCGRTVFDSRQQWPQCYTVVRLIQKCVIM